MAKITDPMERLTASIYEAAISESGLNNALRTLAEVTHCQAASLEVYSRNPRVFRAGRNPLIEPDYAQSFLSYWRHRQPKRKTDGCTSLGQTLRSSDIFDREAVTNSAFFHEWLRPQGLGGDGRYATVAIGDGEIATLGVFKPFQSPEFSQSDHQLFAIASRHFQRAVEIHRRLQIAELQKKAAVPDDARSGCIIVDDSARILDAHGATQQLLQSAGLIDPGGKLGFLGTTSKRASPAVGEAAGARRFQVGGEDGVTLQITVIPLADTVLPDDPWLAINKRAALVYVSAPGAAIKQRVKLLAKEYGLTPAEQAVAVETAKGRGRAAVAAQLGIREATVRSHLSAIFNKLQIHRQAELTRLILSESSAML